MYGRQGELAGLNVLLSLLNRVSAAPNLEDIFYQWLRQKIGDIKPRSRLRSASASAYSAEDVA